MAAVGGADPALHEKGSVVQVDTFAVIGRIRAGTPTASDIQELGACIGADADKRAEVFDEDIVELMTPLLDQEHLAAGAARVLEAVARGTASMRESILDEDEGVFASILALLSRAAAKQHIEVELADPRLPPAETSALTALRCAILDSQDRTGHFMESEAPRVTLEVLKASKSLHKSTIIAALGLVGCIGGISISHHPALVDSGLLRAATSLLDSPSPSVGKAAGNALVAVGTADKFNHDTTGASIRGVDCDMLCRGIVILENPRSKPEDERCLAVWYAILKAYFVHRSEMWDDFDRMAASVRSLTSRCIGAEVPSEASAGAGAAAEGDAAAGGDKGLLLNVPVDERAKLVEAVAYFVSRGGEPAAELAKSLGWAKAAVSRLASESLPMYKSAALMVLVLCQKDVSTQAVHEAGGGAALSRACRRYLGLVEGSGVSAEDLRELLDLLGAALYKLAWGQEDIVAAIAGEPLDWDKFLPLFLEEGSIRGHENLGRILHFFCQFPSSAEAMEWPASREGVTAVTRAIWRDAEEGEPNQFLLQGLGVVMCLQEKDGVPEGRFSVGQYGLEAGLPLLLAELAGQAADADDFSEWHDELVFLCSGFMSAGSVERGLGIVEALHDHEVSTRVLACVCARLRGACEGKGDHWYTVAVGLTYTRNSSVIVAFTGEQWAARAPLLAEAGVMVLKRIRDGDAASKQPDWAPESAKDKVARMLDHLAGLGDVGEGALSLLASWDGKDELVGLLESQDCAPDFLREMRRR